ncbi:MAG: HAD-IA family hydrolase [Chloroflexi bacterium]|nr:HAD-IA family hydrolase [Chloroflexota bacterium]
MADQVPEIIFFDVYGTLAGFDPPREQIQQRAATAFDMELDREGLDRGYRDADHFMAQQNASAPVRLMSPADRALFFARYEQIVLSGAGHDVDLELAGKIWNRVRSQEYGWALFEDVVPGFERLRSNGFRVAAISNMPYGEQEMCETLGLSGHVEFAVTSGDAGVEKPDPRMFRTALERAGVAASKALMVGDSITSDLRAAEAVGMSAVLMDRYNNHPEHDEHPRVKDVYGVAELLGD